MTTKTKTTDPAELSPGIAATIAGDPRMESLAQIKPAPWNPRQTRNKAADAELLASIKEKGVLQSLLVRPVNSHLEVVCGSRRYEQATEAGLVSVPVIVRELDDAEVLELQTIENSQRVDVHPLEEAECYRRMQAEHKTPEEIAAMVGKSRSWVYSRLKLCSLVPKAKAAFLAGKLEPSTALLLARIADESLQEKALAELTHAGWDGQPISYKRALELVQNRYMTELTDCGFDTKDANLVPEAGACTTCPKRSGNQRDLFGDLGRQDYCTDAKCFMAKRDVAWLLESSKAEAQGKRILNEKETKSVFRYGHSDMVPSDAAYVPLDEKTWKGDKQVSYRQLLKQAKAAPTTAIARSPSGKVVELVSRADLVKALPAKERQEVGLRESRSRGLTDQEKKQREEQKRKRAVKALVLGKVAEAAAKAPTGDDFFRFLGEGFCEGSWHDVLTEVCKRRGIEIPKRKGAYSSGSDPEGAIRKELGLLKGGELRGLIVEVLASRGTYSGYYTEGRGMLAKALELLELDKKRLESEARAELKAAEKPARPEKKPAAKKGGRK